MEEILYNLNWCRGFDIPIINSMRMNEEYTDGSKWYHTVYAFVVELIDIDHFEYIFDAMKILSQIEKMAFVEPTLIEDIVKKEGGYKKKITQERYAGLLFPQLQLDKKIRDELSVLEGFNKKAIAQLRIPWEVKKIEWDNYTMFEYRGRFSFARVDKNAGVIPL